MRCNYSHEESDLDEGSAVDRVDGRFVQVCVNRRGQGTSLFSVFEEKQQVRVDQGMRRVVSQVEEILSQPTSTVQATARYPASLVLRHHRSGDYILSAKFCKGLR